MGSVAKLYDDENGIFSLSLEGDAKHLTLPMNISLYDWWRSFSPNLPRRRDFDILDHAKYAAHIFLIEVAGDSKYFFKLNGEEVTHIIGINNTGNYLEYIKNPMSDREKQLNDLVNYYDQMVKNRCCKSCHGNARFVGVNKRMFESIDCPLVNDDDTVSHIVGMMALKVDQ